jgi:hypothetical protein
MSKPSSPDRWASTARTVLSLLGTLVELAAKVVKLWQLIHW